MHDLSDSAAGPQSGPELGWAFQHQLSHAGQAQFNGQYQTGELGAHDDHLGMHYLPSFTTPFAQLLVLASMPQGLPQVLGTLYVENEKRRKLASTLRIRFLLAADLPAIGQRRAHRQVSSTEPITLPISMFPWKTGVSANADIMLRGESRRPSDF
ncbi:hypothetical protein JK2ML_1788 [Mycobacterium leprae Kyoto-2]|uniref:Uncharacterized protein n=3 Tax=Mycobacterium leprae TaxID=1769 RepID=Q7AQ24_MYCLE|nr:very hypothetical protein [imported] - Mycobacterium leprae [Mycobacterium leprae]OAR21013.1 hypothetical protein A8144_07945 [Mycobacterium leprae 3125609]OAX71185.1 hypothetical protein A3216_07170 [Mycobacterium leprae 7935681]CAR71883.1 very hypothetical protein [Mycobacterium leprae Br4923]BBC17378.1 hypothetical protein JK2ML_1788 [Mycobacterium leprae Kyoto-2]AWV48244.1 hypothetical protein DIJ64_09840 [Mycobacterium leprae]